MNKVKCFDCDKMVDVSKEMCEIHEDCEDFAWVCDECGGLNVDV